MTLRSSFTIRSHRIAIMLLLAGPIVFLASTAGAQSINPDINNSTTQTPLASTPDAVSEFRRLLADPDIQKWLQEVPELNDPVDQPSFRDHIGDLMVDIRTRFGQLTQAATAARMAPEIIATSWRTQLTSSDSLRVITYIVIFLFVGAAFEWLYSQYTHYRLLKLQLRKPESLAHKLSTALLRASITFGSLIVFALGSIGAFISFEWPDLVDDIVLDFLIVVLSVRVTMTVSRFFLAPRFKELRLVPFTDRQSQSLYHWINMLVFFGVANYAALDIFTKITRMSTDPVPQSAALSIAVISNFLLLIVILFAINSVRKLFPVSSTIWPVYLTILSVSTFILWTIGTPQLMWSILILGLLPPVIHLCRHWVDSLFDQAENLDVLQGETSNSDPNVESTALAAAADNNAVSGEVQAATTSESDSTSLPDSEHDDIDLHEFKVQRFENYRPIAQRLVRFALVIIAVISLVLSWDINLFELSSSPTLAGKLLQISIDIVIAYLIADLIWVWAGSAIDRRLADYEPPPPGHAPGPEARMATLLPLLRTMLMVTLVTMVVLSILSSFGVNIGPLLAGAGVVGVAIGFGAQALVRDVVSGIFFLIDDAFRIGEYVEIDSLRGSVESMSIRSLRIRHHRGAVHTIPFGELKSLTNYSRDWVIMKLEFRVPFDTDLKLVKKLVKGIGNELQQNLEYGDSLLQPLKSQGVRRMEEFNMVVGVKFMAKPGEQWLIRRDAYQKVRDAFDANGILFAERNVKVEVLNKESLDAETEKAAMGAAHSVIDQAQPPRPVPDEP